MGMLNFVTQKRILDVNGEKKVKYNAKILHKGVVDLKEIGERVAIASTLHPAEAELAVEIIVDAMMNALCMGQIVDMGRLGRFKPSIKAKTVDSPEEVNADTITDVTCIFKPSVEMKRQLKHTPIHRERELSEKTQQDNFSIHFYYKMNNLKSRLQKYEQMEKELQDKGLLNPDV